MGIPTKPGHGIPHRGKVDHRRDPGEVLHQDPRGGESDLGLANGFGVNIRQGFDILGRYIKPVLRPQQVLQKNPKANRKGFGFGKSGIKCLEAVVAKGAILNGKRGQGGKRIGHEFLSNKGVGESRIIQSFS